MTNDWKTRTKLVHEGIRRSQYGEMSEAIFLTQGFVYDSAEAAEARFIKAGEDEFIYARYGNPTVRMFEDRIAALEGAEDAFATASGMAAVNGALMSMLQAGDHVVSARALFGSCLYILEEVLTPLRGRGDLRRRHRPGPVARGGARRTRRRCSSNRVSNPTLEVIDIARRGRDRPCGGRAGDRRQRLCHADLFARGGAGRRCGGLFHHQAHRRAGPRAGRRDPAARATSSARRLEPYLKHTGGAMSPFTAWMHAQGDGDAGPARAGAGRRRRWHWRRRWRAHAAAGAGDLSGPCRHPQHDLAMRADGIGRHGAVARPRGRQGRRRSASSTRWRSSRSPTTWATRKAIVTHPATTTHQRLRRDSGARLASRRGWCGCRSGWRIATT